MSSQANTDMAPHVPGAWRWLHRRHPGLFHRLSTLDFQEHGAIVMTPMRGVVRLYLDDEVLQVDFRETNVPENGWVFRLAEAVSLIHGQRVPTSQQQAERLRHHLVKYAVSKRRNAVFT